MKPQLASEMLLPTHPAVDFKIKRSHFVRKICRDADKAEPFITDPVKFGWMVKHNVYELVLTHLVRMRDTDADIGFCNRQTNC